MALESRSSRSWLHHPVIGSISSGSGRLPMVRSRMLVSRSEDTTAAAAEANARAFVDDIELIRHHTRPPEVNLYPARVNHGGTQRALKRSSHEKNSAISASVRDEKAGVVPRFKLTIEYAGTRYSGWQIQKNARTVAGEIDRATRTVTGRKDFELYGSGRTDAGVHASGQIAHLDVATTLPAETLRRRINDELPADINLLSATQVPHRFHARHDAVARRYLYQIARRRTAFAKNFVWWVKEPLDAAPMRSAAQAFVGMRDFRSFAAADAQDHAD